MTWKIFAVSLGCAKNLVDTETALGELLSGRFTLTTSADDADLVLVNTCGFIQSARDESRGVIEEYAGIKLSRRPRLKIAVIGCLAQRDGERLKKAFPAIDAVIPLAEYPNLAGLLTEVLRGRRAGQASPSEAAPSSVYEGPRLVSTLPSFAYLRLADGCGNRCAYCAIPDIRGGLRSRAERSILEEARVLEQQGAGELVLIAQDVTAYGNDLGGGTDLARLLGKLLAAVGIPRLRLLYAHPAHIGDGVVDMLLEEPRLCGYLDLPIQHASDRMLKAMGRGYGRDRLDVLLDRFRKHGDFTLRTTLLTGFPGEGEDDFRQALELVESGRFRHLGVFAYSPEEGTPAFSLSGRVSPEEAERRRGILMEAQRKIAFAWLDRRVGKIEDVLIDQAEGRSLLRGRTVREAPDADGAVFVRARGPKPGDVVAATIAARAEYDLIAEPARADGVRT